MSTAAKLIIENVIVLKADKMDMQNAFKAVLLTLLMYAAMFIVGIFACKAIIFLHLVEGVKVEDMAGIHLLITGALSAAIIWAGLKGRTKEALVLGATAAMISGIVAFAVACVAFAA